VAVKVRVAVTAAEDNGAEASEPRNATAPTYAMNGGRQLTVRGR